MSGRARSEHVVARALALALATLAAAVVADRQPVLATPRSAAQAPRPAADGFIARGRVEAPIPDGVQPPGPAVIPAEWEPALGAIVRWPLRVPVDLVKEIASDDTLFVLVPEDRVEEARTGLLSLGIEPAALELIPGAPTSSYPRDFGPHQILDGEGRLGILDHVFAGWPLYPDAWEDGASREPEYTWRPDEGDDDAPLYVAEHMQLPLYRFPGYLTGGNFLVDGMGTAFATEAQIEENSLLYTPDEFRSLVAEYAGIERIHVLRHTEALGIQHIDTWLKVLDPGRLLVVRPPVGHPEEARIDASLEILARTESPYGRPYEILRIDAGELPPRRRERPELWPDETGTAPYTNALILNHKVLVPLFDIDTDERAIATWERAMPGHEVIGYPYADWRSYDALHCRTRAIFDPEMIRIRHVPAVGALTSGSPITIHARIDRYGGASLGEPGPEVVFLVAGESEWRRASMTAGEEGAWEAALQGLSDGIGIEYYLRAAGSSGREVTLPATAPATTFRIAPAASSNR